VVAEAAGRVVREATRLVVAEAAAPVRAEAAPPARAAAAPGLAAPVLRLVLRGRRHVHARLARVRRVCAAGIVGGGIGGGGRHGLFSLVAPRRGEGGGRRGAPRRRGAAGRLGGGPRGGAGVRRRGVEVVVGRGGDGAAVDCRAGGAGGVRRGRGLEGIGLHCGGRMEGMALFGSAVAAFEFWEVIR
jgi:hypothetical protein